jgi:hypothetical protein
MKTKIKRVNLIISHVNPKFLLVLGGYLKLCQVSFKYHLDIKVCTPMDITYFDILINTQNANYSFCENQMRFTSSEKIENQLG